MDGGDITCIKSYVAGGITYYVIRGEFFSSLRPESNDMTITDIYCEISKTILT